VFTYGTYELLFINDAQIYAYTRTLDKEKMMVIANLSAKTAEFQGVSLDGQNLLLNNYPVSKHQPLEKIALKPYETRVYRV